MRTTERIQQEMRSRTDRGLTEEEVTASRQAHGANVLTRVKTKSFLRHFFGNLGDPVIRILLCALGVNLIFVFRGGDWIETVGIAISVFLATLISTLSERGSEAAFRRLSLECDAATARVRREGEIREIPVEELVVGDVVLVSAGEQIGADGFVISGTLGVDQSSMTGENREVFKCRSNDVSKNPNGRSAVLRGCPVLSGEGEMEVFAVGDATFLGQISREVQMETRESPLKLRLSKLAKQISYLGYGAAILVAMAYLFNTFCMDSGFHLPQRLLPHIIRCRATLGYSAHGFHRRHLAIFHRRHTQIHPCLRLLGLGQIACQMHIAFTLCRISDMSPHIQIHGKAVKFLLTADQCHCQLHSTLHIAHLGCQHHSNHIFRNAPGLCAIRQGIIAAANAIFLTVTNQRCTIRRQ